MTESVNGQTAVINCQAVLSDLDGTLIDSEYCVDYAWQVWAQERQLDLAYIMANAHGRRTVDSVRALTPHLDLETEVAYLEELEISCTRDMVAIEGVREFFDEMHRADINKRLAVVTSGSKKLATHRLSHVGLHIPRVFITADDITHGKPDPEGYLTAARTLGFEPRQCVVFEDSPAGIEAARAAGMRVVAVAFKAGERDISAADYVVHDLKQLHARVDDEGITITLRDFKARERSDIG